MCIALLSSAHPHYKLILLNNRDEYLNRPTAPATWWPTPHTTVLGGRDLLRSINGTWLGVTRSGKIAVLTNFREDVTPLSTAVSRGAIIREFLTSNDEDSIEEFARKVIDTGIARDAGGFSLVCGKMGERLAVISNRAESSGRVPLILGEMVQTVGLSNAAFEDRSWRKVNEGEEGMLRIIRTGVRDEVGEDELIEGFLDLLSRDTLTRVEGGQGHNGLETYVKELRNTILVPALGRKDVDELRGDEMAAAKGEGKADVVDQSASQEAKQLGVSGLYGTQKQTVILVDHDFNVRYFERTLYDQNSDPVPKGQGDVDIKFKVEP